MDYEPLAPGELAFVLSMIGTGNGWPTKARIVALVGSFEGGNWLSAPDVADVIGLSPGRTSIALAQLADERVLLRDGTRRFWYEVNPDLSRWRVPWRHDPREVRRMLAWWREQVMDTARERFIARPMHARCASVIARLMGARSAPDERPLSRVPWPRDNGGGGGGLSRVQGARSGGGLRLVQGRAIAKGAGAKSNSPVGREALGSWVGEDQPTTTVDPGHLARAKAAVMSRALTPPGRRKFLNGAPLDQLAELVARHGVDDVVRAAGDAEPDLVPGLVEAMQMALDHPDVEHGQEHAAAAAQAVERKRYLLQRIPVLEEILSADPDDEVRLGELVACQTELRELDEGAA